MSVAAAIVLVIACTNVAVLVLLRALNRQKEMAVRIALGAGRRHMIRLLIAESSLLCASVIPLAVGVTAFALKVLGPFIESQLGRPAPRGAGAIGVDGTMLLAIAIAGAVIAFSFSLAPLATPWHRKLADTLRTAGRGDTDRPAMRRIRSALIGFQLAGSLVLLVGCWMMVHSVVAMLDTDLGYHVDGVSRVRLMLPVRAYPDSAARGAFVRRISARIENAVRAPVALANWPPFAASTAHPIIADDDTESRLSAAVTAVGTDYFRVLGITLREGRAFTAEDRDGTVPVAIVSEALAQRLWPTSSALGHRLRAAGVLRTTTPSEKWRTVVGIVHDVRQTYVDADVADVYVPEFQAAPEQYLSLYMKTSADSRTLMSQLHDAIATTDPYAVIRGVGLVADENRQLAGARVLATMLSVFGALAAFLSIVGMYGVVAFAVRQRQREFAVRVALGATRRAITALSMRNGMRLLAIALAGGSLAAVGVGHVLRNRLYG
ncbi:MAG: FtsX-like permease family protein, partial [Gemmatimonadaceae bacterium]